MRNEYQHPGFESNTLDSSDTFNQSALRRWTASRTLVVGIGGTGCITCQHALGYVRRRFGGVRPPFVEFAVFDTAAQESGQRTKLEVGDFARIAGFNANRYFQHADKYSWLDWLPVGDYLPGEINVGAAKPPVGRLSYFMYREGLIKALIEDKLRKLSEETLPNRVAHLPRPERIDLDPDAILAIHLVASVFGGTGAGSLLDAAHDLRRWCEEVTGHRPQVIGHLVLPDAFQIRCSVHIRRQHRATAYAMLAQINHFMGCNKATVTYKLGMPVEWSETEHPFDFCFLLDGASGTSATSRERICDRIGRMIALWATEDAGRLLSNNMFNVYHGLTARGTERADLAVYSSYDLAIGSRPTSAAFDALARKAVERIAETAAEALSPIEFDRSGIVTQPEKLLDVPALVEDFTKPFRIAVDTLVDRKNNGQIGQRDIKEPGLKLADVVRGCLDRVRTEMPNRLKELTARWQHEKHDVLPLEVFLDNWLRSGASVTSLPSALASFGRDIQQRIDDSKPSPTTAPEPTELNDWVQKQPENAWHHLADIRRLFPEYVAKFLRHTWEVRLPELHSRLLHGAAEVARRARELAKQCSAEVRAAQSGPPARGVSNGASGCHVLYSADEVSLEDHGLADSFNRVLKRLAVSLVREETPKNGYVKEVRNLLQPDSTLGRELKQSLDSYFTDYERRALAGEGATAHADELKAGLGRLRDAASPRWLVADDKSDELDAVDCLVFPSTIPLDRVADELGMRDINATADPIATEALVVRTKHGAALRHLKNLELYAQAFEEIVSGRKAAARPGGRPFDETAMWLDPKWKVVRPTRESAATSVIREALVTFGMLWEAGRIKGDLGDEWFFATSEGMPKEANESLGKDLPEALRTWCTPVNAEKVQRLYDAIKQSPLGDRVERGRSLVKRLENEVALERPVVRTSMERICDAVVEDLERWEENLRLSTPPVQKEQPQAAPGQ